MKNKLYGILKIFAVIILVIVTIIFWEIDTVLGVIASVYLIIIGMLKMLNIIRRFRMENESLREVEKEEIDKFINALLIIGIPFFVISLVLIVYNMRSETIDKPVIYLYPEQETEIEVKVIYPERLTCTYPKYEDSWKVLASPSGDLTDMETGRNLYCLYYEGLNTIETSQDEGFVVKGEDTISFLEEKLEILGLTEREANEFIIYWLPKLEANEYNFIRFQTIEEINENMPLEITPTPDTVIRVMMEYKALEGYKEVKEQILTTPIREGFTVVEWGGTEIK